MELFKKIQKLFDIFRYKLTKGSQSTKTPHDDLVDEASEESFPASDPPPWTSGVPDENDEHKHKEEGKNTPKD